MLIINTPYNELYLLKLLLVINTPCILPLLVPLPIYTRQNPITS